ncbi:MAG TPA: hypothetical protein VL832_22305 [Puia sp.]|jgi:hypothetical protein|nr:hypothetical protein [Puia sp.]
MKKIVSIATVLTIPFLSNAQSISSLIGDQDISRSMVAILVLYLAGIFTLAMIKAIQDYRLKFKMMEKGVSERVIEQFLQPATRKDAKQQSIKWFLVLAAIGLGLTIVNFTLPLGIHSVAIMAFSISLSFLGYYFFIRKSDQKGNE